MYQIVYWMKMFSDGLVQSPQPNIPFYKKCLMFIDLIQQRSVKSSFLSPKILLTENRKDIEYRIEFLKDVLENNTQLQTELGGNRYIEIQNENIVVEIQSDSNITIPSLLMAIENNGTTIFTDLELIQGSNFINVNNEFDGYHVLVLLSGYTGNEINFDTLVISVDANIASSLGDIDGNGVVDILDVIQLINNILDNNYQLNADINSDGILNIIDIVLLVNTILD